MKLVNHPVRAERTVFYLKHTFSSEVSPEEEKERISFDFPARTDIVNTGEDRTTKKPIYLIL